MATSHSSATQLTTPSVTYLAELIAPTPSLGLSDIALKLTHSKFKNVFKIQLLRLNQFPWVYLKSQIIVEMKINPVM